MLMTQAPAISPTSKFVKTNGTKNHHYCVLTPFSCIMSVITSAIDITAFDATGGDLYFAWVLQSFNSGSVSYASPPSLGTEVAIASFTGTDFNTVNGIALHDSFLILPTEGATVYGCRFRDEFTGDQGAAVSQVGGISTSTKFYKSPYSVY